MVQAFAMVNLNITSAATMLSEAHDSGLIPSDSPLLIILYPLLIIIAFVGLAVVCDEILEPTLEELSISLRIPHDVAAATFLSLGSSAPEISMSCLATYRGKIELSLGATLGSAIIAFSVIPAFVYLFTLWQFLLLASSSLSNLAFISIMFDSISIK